MAWGTRERMTPLHVGTAGRFGRDGESLSGNLANIERDSSKFARWGYGSDYHVGDLSHALFGWEAYREPSPASEGWAERLFESSDPPVLRDAVSVLLVPWYESSLGIHGEHFPLAELKEQLIAQALREFPDTLLNAASRKPRAASGPASATRASLSPNPRPEPASSSEAKSDADLILVGCVKTKRDEPAPAKDLYISPLFNKRRRYAEQHRIPWMILSAKEPGFIPIDEVLAPYDRMMNKLSADERDSWARAQPYPRGSCSLGSTSPMAPGSKSTPERPTSPPSVEYSMSSGRTSRSSPHSLV